LLTHSYVHTNTSHTHTHTHTHTHIHTYTHSGHVGELWPSFIEKAYAKVRLSVQKNLEFTKPTLCLHLHGPYQNKSMSCFTCCCSHSSCDYTSHITFFTFHHSCPLKPMFKPTLLPCFNVTLLMLMLSLLLYFPRHLSFSRPFPVFSNQHPNQNPPSLFQCHAPHTPALTPLLPC